MDLSWLKLNSGKKQVWELAHPSRMNGLFRQAAMDVCGQFSVKAGSIVFTDNCGSDAPLPAGFDEAFDLRRIPPEDNPYYVAAVALAESFRLDLDRDSDNAVMPLIHKFVAILEPRFKNLLEQKDERALLLLLYWFAMVCHRRLWWLWKRARLEGLATCRYLERRWGEDDTLLRGLLVWPRTMIEEAV